MINYTIKYTKDGVELEYNTTFETDPTFEELEALKSNFEYDEILNWIREDS